MQNMQQNMQQMQQTPQGSEGQAPFQGQGGMEQGQVGGPAGAPDSKTTLWYVIVSLPVENAAYINRHLDR